MALARCGERTPASLLHRTPATPALGNQEMQAATPAAVVRGQLIERFHDEALAATWLTRKKLAPASLCSVLCSQQTYDTAAPRAHPSVGSVPCSALKFKVVAGSLDRDVSTAEPTWRSTLSSSSRSFALSSRPLLAYAATTASAITNPLAFPAQQDSRRHQLLEPACFYPLC